MAAKTGRTTYKWLQFDVDDSGGTLRTIPINSLSVVGLKYDELDLTAWMDAVKGALPLVPECVIEIGGPFDTTAAQTAGTMSGSHTVLYNLPGVTGATFLSLGIKFGIRQAWDTEPVFGLTGTAANGFICMSYIVNPADMTYTARFVTAPGSAAPAWGTSAVT